MTLKNTLVDFWRELHRKEGYVEIQTPIILTRTLWENSGHWDHYKDNMYTTVIDEEDCAVKPMNCPGGMLVYKLSPHSYKDLPLRMAEMGMVHVTKRADNCTDCSACAALRRTTRISLCFPSRLRTK